jgi:hypothetical protein
MDQHTHYYVFSEVARHNQNEIILCCMFDLNIPCCWQDRYSLSCQMRSNDQWCCTLAFGRLTKPESRQGRFEINLETNWGRKEDIQFLTGKLLPVFERLEGLNEVIVFASIRCT